jgi:carbamoyltransferase
MSARVLGISAFFHDSSAALIADGEVVAVAAEERFSRIKHDANFPTQAIAFCLDRAGLKPENLDAVVFYEQPHVKLTRVITSVLAGFPRSRTSFVHAAKRWMGKYLWTLNVISRELDVDPRKVRMVPHHLSHAAQAFATAPFEQAAILTVDAVGEWACTAISVGNRASTTPLQIIETQSYPHSLGLAYAAFTGFLGFKPNDGEASTMALSAFGAPRFRKEVEAVIQAESGGHYKLDQRFFDFLKPDYGVFTPHFRKTFGEPRRYGSNWQFDSLADNDNDVPPDDRRYADIAASVQAVTEEVLLGLARRAKVLTNAANLCISGGVALNACANGRIIREAGFESVFIPPDPGDGGAAVGAAWLGYSGISKCYRPLVLTPYLGLDDPDEPSADFLTALDFSEWTPADSSTPPGEVNIQWEFCNDLRRLSGLVVEELFAGHIVGWVQGRFEIGPRALGARSILADPQNLAAIRKLSREVKHRKPFRPYALSVREEDAKRVFPHMATIPHPARWMLTVEKVNPELLPLVRGAVHRDGTTRPQICGPNDNLRLHTLLNAIAERRGLGGVLNTSFNEAGYPMVASAQEALLVFAKTSMDAIVINDCFIRKTRPENTQESHVKH